MAPLSGSVVPPPQPQLPRELLKWIQSLDLSYALKNVKRDLSNGFLIAEVFSRYYPQDVEMHTFDNGSRTATKNDNWEQLYKILNRRGVQITRLEIDPVVNQVPGAAVLVLTKLYQNLTKRAIPKIEVASTSLDAAAAAAAVVEGAAAGGGHTTEQRRPSKEGLAGPQDAFSLKAANQAQPTITDSQDAYSIFQSTRRSRPSGRGQSKTVQTLEVVAPLMIREPVVKKLERNVASLRAQRDLQQQQQSQLQQQRSRTTTSMSGRKSVGGAQDGSGAQPSTPSPGHSVKPIIDLMRSLVSTVLQENDHVVKSLDPRKDVVVSFMELCGRGDVVPDEMTVRVFESLSSRTALLVETLVKSPTEFYRFWSLLAPALADFPESSPVFESVVLLFKRTGEQMREADPVLTQQLLLDVGFPSLGPLILETAGKREPLCELIYSFAQESLQNHLNVLKALKETLGKLPIYITCLSCMVSLETQSGLMQEGGPGLLDLYIYYALVGLQNPQPKVRVAGLCILSSIVAAPGPSYQSVLTNGFPTLQGLVADDWWEVKAQLLILAGRLLQRCQPQAELDNPDGPPPTEEQIESLLGIVFQCFQPSLSKNVLQVGLSALAPVLKTYEALLPSFVSILLAQPHPLRRRLLGMDSTTAGEVRRLAYVMGTSSRLYEESPLPLSWPAVAVARTFADHVTEAGMNHFETEHMEILSACLPEGDFEEGSPETEEWLRVYEKVKDYIMVALVDPELHHPATELVRRFWLSRSPSVVSQCVELSRRSLLQTLRILYSTTLDRTKVDESRFLDFLMELKSAGGIVEEALAQTVDSFRESNQQEYSASSLDKVFS